MDQWIRRFRSAKTVEGYESVVIPGDPERITEAERMSAGIPLLPAVVEDLSDLGEKFGIPFKK